MLETSARLLRLLSLLQARRDWTGAELAARLGVTTRTIRNDVDRLRGLGYPVDARPGVAGGYRLGAGGALPPLLLDDEEAVAVAIGLRTAASGSVAGIEETSVRALAKLQQVLPSRLRHRVSAFESHALPMPAPGPQVDPDVLTADRRRLPRPRAAAVRLPVALRGGQPARGGAVPPGQRPAALVPAGLGRRPGRLAHLPGRPDRAADADRAALHARARCRPTTRSRRRWPAASARRPGGTGPG